MMTYEEAKEEVERILIEPLRRGIRTGDAWVHTLGAGTNKLGAGTNKPIPWTDNFYIVDDLVEWAVWTVCFHGNIDTTYRYRLLDFYADFCPVHVDILGKKMTGRTM